MKTFLRLTGCLLIVGCLVAGAWLSALFLALVVASSWLAPRVRRLFDA